MIFFSILLFVCCAWMIFFLLRKRKVVPVSVSVVIILLVLTFASGIGRSYATAIYCVPAMFGGYCPIDSTIWIDAFLDKGSYAPGEPVTLTYIGRSDDHPLPGSGSGICLKAIARVNSGSWGGDAYPGCYSAQNVRDGLVMGYGSAGVAPPASGNVEVSLSSNGYTIVGGYLSLTVASPPTVNLYFSRFDVLKTSVLSYVDTFLQKITIDKAFAEGL
jgi:hypothetical protein